MSLPTPGLRQWMIGTAGTLSLAAIIALAASVSSYNYLLFHAMVELFSVVVACVMGTVAWYAFRFSRNNFLIFLGAAFPAIALIDLVHTLAYRGMGVFPADPNQATQLWIAARALEAAALLLAPTYLERPLRPLFAMLAFLAVALLCWRSIKMTQNL